MTPEYIITTQAELDALPESFDVLTIIRIKDAPGTLTLEFHRANSQVILENSRGVFRGNSRGVFWGNSRGEFWGNSSGEFWGNSSGVFRENSSGVFRENSSGVAWQNAVLRVLSAGVTIEKARDFSVIILQDIDAVKIGSKADTCSVVLTKTTGWTKESFLEFHALTPDADGHIQLVKITDENGFDYYTGKIKYEGEVICPDWDATPERECGGGLHCSATEALARRYQSTGFAKIVKVHVDDFVVYPHNIDKVRCRRVVVA